MEKNRNLTKVYKLFSRFYRGREDCVAIWKDGAYSQIPGGFTYERFRQHVELVNTYALYQMDDSGNVLFCLFDLDVFPRNQPWKVLVKKISLEKEKTQCAIKTLLTLGIKRENILIEFPTVGYHLLIFFSKPTPAVVVKKFMQMTLAKSGLSETPFYPRKVEKGTCGDRIQLPFRINNNTNRRSNLVRDIESFDPENYDQTPDFIPLEQLKLVDSKLIIQLVENPVT